MIASEARKLIGVGLRRLREQAGMDAASAAEAAKVHQTAIYKSERGEALGIDTFLALLSAYTGGNQCRDPWRVLSDAAAAVGLISSADLPPPRKPGRPKKKG